MKGNEDEVNVNRTNSKRNRIEFGAKEKKKQNIETDQQQ